MSPNLLNVYTKLSSQNHPALPLFIKFLMQEKKVLDALTHLQTQTPEVQKIIIQNNEQENLAKLLELYTDERGDLLRIQNTSIAKGLDK